jgi:hypothetical protein
MDRRGVVGFPLRLSVTFVILAVSLPAMLHALGCLEGGAGAAAAEAEAEKVRDAASRAYYSGAGSACSVDVSVSRDYRLVIGGEGADAYSISVWRGGEETSRTYMQRPPVRILNAEPLEISGDRGLLLRCVSSGAGYGVEVSVAA